MTLDPPERSWMRSVSPNREGRDLVVGDLHGCVKILDLHLLRVKFDREVDRLFSVGDLVDRGPESMECLRLLREPWFHAVRGNHEDMMIDVVLRGSDPEVWDWNGGEWRLGADPGELRELCELADRLPVALVIEGKSGERVGICHAQSPESGAWTEGDFAASMERGFGHQEVLWGRDRVVGRTEPPVVVVDWTYHGHSVTLEPVRRGPESWIDLGCYLTDRLHVERIFE